MRNLKKVLTLVLTVAMVLSIMVVGTGAAFSDQDQIKNKEAVDVCTTLNIIAGMEDGSYRPANNVTRAQMCKMICVALNGGKEPTLGTNATPTFSDVRTDPSSSWAESFIESCNSQGIVSGVGGGRFSPSGSVTGTQAARMLLVALGYRADLQGFTGDSWAINVNTIASAKGLYAGIESIDANAALSRDNAAQMIWNALNAYEVEYVSQLSTVNGVLTSELVAQDKISSGLNTKITMLEDKYEADTAIGTFTGNHDMYSGIKDGNIRISNATINGSGNGTYQFKYDFDLNYIGEEIKVLYRDGTDGVKDQLDEKDTIYGIYVTGTTTVYNIKMDDIQNVDQTNHKIKFNDTEYDYVTGTSGTPAVNNGNIYYNFKNTATVMNDANMAVLEKQSGDTIKFIANDNGDIVTAYVTNTILAKVNSVNAESVSISNGIGAIDIDDNDIYSGIAKDDVVTVTTYYKGAATDSGAYSVVKKAETVSGNLTGYKGAVAADISNVSVDGTTYSVNYKTLNDKLTDDGKEAFVTGDINSAVTLFLVNGFVGAVDVPASSSNYAVVTGVDSTNTGTSGSLNEFRMKVTLADGTSKVVTVDEDSYILDANNVNKIAALNSTNIKAGYLVKYASISSADVMDLTAVYGTTSGTISNIYNKDLKTFNGVMTDYDAVLFVNVGTKYYAYNIRNLNNVSIESQKYTSVTNGDGKVVAAFVEQGNKPSGSTSDTIYGIVSANLGNVKVNGDDQRQFTVSNNKGDYTVYLPANSTKIDKGDIVYFEKTTDDVYSNNEMNLIAEDANYPGGIYVKEMDKGNVLSFYTYVVKNGSVYEGRGLDNIALDSDAQIVYVNQDTDKAGAENGVNEFDEITGYANAAIVLNSSGKIDAVIVETSNKADILAPMPVVTSVTGATAGNGDTITVNVVNSGLSSSGTYTVKIMTTASTPAEVTELTSSTISVAATGTATISLAEKSDATLAVGTYTAVVLNASNDTVATYTFTTAA